MKLNHGLCRSVHLCFLSNAHVQRLDTLTDVTDNGLKYTMKGVTGHIDWYDTMEGNIMHQTEADLCAQNDM